MSYFYRYSTCFNVFIPRPVTTSFERFIAVLVRGSCILKLSGTVPVRGPSKKGNRTETGPDFKALWTSHLLWKAGPGTSGRCSSDLLCRYPAATSGSTVSNYVLGPETYSQPQHRSLLDNSSNWFINAALMDYHFNIQTPDSITNTLPNSYSAEQSHTQKLETQWRYAAEKVDVTSWSQCYGGEIKHQPALDCHIARVHFNYQVCPGTEVSASPCSLTAPCRPTIVWITPA